MHFKTQIIFLLLTIGLSTTGCMAHRSTSSDPNAAFDEDGNKIPDSEVDISALAWRPLDPERDGITGIGVLTFPWKTDACTATLLDTGVRNGPAYVLTNGHCNFFEHMGLDFLGATEFRTNQYTRYHIIFNHFISVPAAKRQDFALSKLTYITESGTDVAIFEVAADLEALARAGIKPIPLARQRPRFGDKVRLIGIPLLYVSKEKMSLQVSECKVEGVVALRNWIYSAPESVIHHCTSLPGFSGGPLLSMDTGEIVLLNSHGSDDQSTDPPCSYETKPCEVAPDGTEKVVPERNYAQYVDGIADCFDSRGVFKLSLPACRLPK